MPPWRPGDALGAAGARVFTRASGKPLTEGIPGFYTVNGFYTVLLPALGNSTKQVASESWVLGTRSELAPDSVEAQRLERDVIALYEADYAKQWDAMLADLNVVPLRSPEQAVQDLYILASPQSPMRDLLASVARQLTLSQPPPVPPSAAGAAGKEAEKEAVAAAQRKLPQSTLRPLLAAQASTLPTTPPGKEIDDRYRNLRDYVGTGPGAPIDQTLKAMDALHQQLARLGAIAVAGGSGPPLAGRGCGIAAARGSDRRTAAGLALARGDGRQRHGGPHRQHAPTRRKKAYNAPGGAGGAVPAGGQRPLPVQPRLQQ